MIKGFDFFLPVQVRVKQYSEYLMCILAWATKNFISCVPTIYVLLHHSSVSLDACSSLHTHIHLYSCKTSSNENTDRYLFLVAHSCINSGIDRTVHLEHETGLWLQFSVWICSNESVICKIRWWPWLSSWYTKCPVTFGGNWDYVGMDISVEIIERVRKLSSLKCCV